MRRMKVDRVTDTHITNRIARLQKQGIDLGIDGQYGQFRVTNKSGSKNMSPRLPNRQIMDWLEAYELGWDAAMCHVGVRLDRIETTVDRAMETERGLESK